MLKELFHNGVYGPFMRDWVAKKVFLIQILLIFGSCYNNIIATFEIYALKFTGYLNWANKIFQEWTVFVFIESWSLGQVMQKAYWFFCKIDF